MAKSTGIIKGFAIINILWSTAGGQRACSLARSKLIGLSPINFSPPAPALTWVERAHTKCNEISNRLHFRAWLVGNRWVKRLNQIGVGFMKNRELQQSRHFVAEENVNVK
jgi:hypothetical protein